MSASLWTMTLLLGSAIAVQAAEPETLIVWSGSNPVGATWAKLGPRGSIRVEAKTGLQPDTASLTLRFDGEGYRGAGLNWKGWFPADACDDVSRFKSLVFYIRQATAFDDADVSVALVDNVKREPMVPPKTVAVVGDHALAKLDGQWRKVVIPLHKFTQNHPLDLKRIWGIDFSHTGNRPMVLHIDRIGFSMETAAGVPNFPAGPRYRAKVQVDFRQEKHSISDAIYGVANLPVEKRREWAIPITRLGGNPSTRLNWKLNVENAAHDWFFKNRGRLIHDLQESPYLKHIRENQSIGATSYITIPMIGWVAKDDHSYGFSVKKYGLQKATEPGHPDVGNGLDPQGRPIRGNDPRDTSIVATPQFVQEAVAFVVKHAGSAAQGGVRYWVLDNEPMLWHVTHRDVRPEPLGYDELWERTVQYAEAIKRADPTAQVAGFCSWGWLDLFYSAVDAADDYRAKKDYLAHQHTPLVVWYLQKCAEYRKKHGKPLVDVLDVHWYPQGRVGSRDVYQGKGLDAELNTLRLRSTRELWDANYRSESWLRDVDQGEAIRLLPRLREWIDRHNPGMKLSLGEYHFGGTDNRTGAVVQAELFAIFAQERLDMAFLWHTPEGTQNLAWQAFRNYDGQGGRFGNRWVPSQSDAEQLRVVAAKHAHADHWTVMLINKHLNSPAEVTLTGWPTQRPTRFFGIDAGEFREQKPAELSMVPPDEIRLIVPAASILLMESRR